MSNKKTNMETIDEELAQDVKTQEVLKEIAENGLNKVGVVKTSEEEVEDDISDEAQYLGIGLGDFIEEEVPNQ